MRSDNRSPSKRCGIPRDTCATWSRRRMSSRPRETAMKTQGVHRLALACAAALACGAVAAAGLKIQMPPETAALKVAPGSELAAGQCGTCHSADYVSTQPRDKPCLLYTSDA